MTVGTLTLALATLASVTLTLINVSNLKGHFFLFSVVVFLVLFFFREILGFVLYICIDII